MATDNQFALTRAYRGGAPNLNKTARQVVPQFLQKLYEIVNDPTNNDLIRWSDNGDSFFVLDNERFRDVLGRWFKHQKFPSFVRQLNMYGFHKIPHLQHGTLKSDSETELWNFEHPNFLRGQPDLLCLIQRKKQANQGANAPSQGEEIQHPGHPIEPSVNQLGSGGVPQGPLGIPSNTQILDINSILNGIAAVKRHQQTISADLNELKSSNQHLWQEAITARERHKAHQDTINRILKFLASVFGNKGGHDGRGRGGHSPGQQIIPRKRQRLMIGDGSENKDDDGSGFEIVDDEELSNAQSPRFDTPRGISPNVFASIETPSTDASPRIFSEEAASPAASAASEAFSSRLTPQPPRPSVSRTTSNARLTPGPSRTPSHISTTSSLISAPEPTYPSVPLPAPISDLPSDSNNYSTALLPTNVNSTSQDAVLQAAFQQLLKSPNQMQMFLQALQTQSMPPTAGPSVPYSSSPPPQPQPQSQPNTQLAPYEPPFDFSSFISMPPPSPVPSSSHLKAGCSSSVQDAGVGALLPKDDASSLEPLLDNTANLQKTYRETTEIEKDMDTLHASIHSLLENMGLNPSLLATQTQSDPQQPSEPLPPALPSTSASISQSAPPPQSFPLPPSQSLPLPQGQDVSMSHDEQDQDPSINVTDIDFEAFLRQFAAQQNGENGLGFNDLGGMGMGMGMNLGYPNDEDPNDTVVNAANIAELDDITGSHAQTQSQFGDGSASLRPVNGAGASVGPGGFITGVGGDGHGHIGKVEEEEEDPQLEELHAFLDEVASASSGASPILRAQQDSPAAGRSPLPSPLVGLGKKRKSDVADLASELPLSVEDSEVVRGGSSSPKVATTNGAGRPKRARK